MMFCAGSSIVFNFGFLLLGGSGTFMSSMPFETDIGTITMVPDTSALNWMTLFKMVSAIFILIQGRGAYKIFSPILKGYRDVESGAAQGIPMNARQVPKMKQHVQLVKKLTCCHVLIFFISIIICRGFMLDMAD